MKLPDENSDITERLRVWANMDLDYSTTRSSYNDVHEACNVIDAERALADKLADELEFILAAPRSLSAVDLDKAKRVLARWREARQQR